MPRIIPADTSKKVSKVQNSFQQRSAQITNFGNIQFPFNKPFGQSKYGNVAPAAQNQGIKIPPPGEGLPRVLHYCADQSGCAFWRMIWPGDELLATNKAVVMTLYQMVTIGQFYGGIDAVRLQRQCTEPQFEFIKFLRTVSDQLKTQTGKGFRIIWEVDDIILPASDIPDYNVCKGAFETDAVYNTVKKIMPYVDEMTVVSEYMRQHYIKHLGFNKISVIPNYAPKHWIDRGVERETTLNNYRKHKQKPRILYAGSGTHFDVNNKVGQNDDFGHVVDAIIKDLTVDKKYEWVFFGALPLKLRQFIGKGIEFHDWCPINEYADKLRKLNVNVAIAPLQKNNFSRSKANIKLTETGMQRVPCIAQNIECYNSSDWKYLFDSSEELFNKISEVVKDENSYMEASDYARKYSEKYILQDHLDEFTLLYTTEYGDQRRQQNKNFWENNRSQFA
jgi:hypothetical protein